MLQNKIKKLKGFTLLELVIVIAIIGILAVIVLPNFIQALAKARDAKKMTELRGVQTFLTTVGIDTSLRYPVAESDLRVWFALTKNRLPNGLATTTAQYHYAGLGCDNTTTIVGGQTQTSTCSSYQLWTELEVDNAALRLDADLIGAATGAACNATTGTCVPIGDIVAAASTLPSGTANSGVAGNTGGGAMEACTNGNASDCIFDLVP